MDKNNEKEVRNELNKIECEMSSLRKKRDECREIINDIIKNKLYEERRKKYIGKCYKVISAFRFPKFEKIAYIKIINVVDDGKYALCICIVDHGEHEKGIYIDKIPLWDSIYSMALEPDEKNRIKLVDNLYEIKQYDFFEYSTNIFSEIMEAGGGRDICLKSMT